jgi:CheY-like chemotaxis protein
MRNRVNKPVILLVEDDESHVMLIKRFLNDTNAAKEVLRVADGKDALDYLFRSGNYADERKSPRPDLILLDLRIPKVDGLRVLEKIKESEEVMDIPVVVLTTSEDEADITRAYRNHANSYLVKPSDIDEFGEMMKETYSYWLNWNRYPR